MGNTHDTSHNTHSYASKSEEDEYLSYISKEENVALIETFNTLSKLSRPSKPSPGKAKSDDKTVQSPHQKDSDDLFYLANYSEFSDLLHKRRVYEDLKVFRKYIVKFSMTTSTTVISTLWDMLKDSPSFPPRDSRAILAAMLIIIHDMAFENGLTMDDIQRSVDRFLEFIQSYHEKILSTSSSKSSDLSLEDFISWTQEHSPFFSAIVETYFHRICWRDQMSPSFVPFCRPIFMDTSSSIVSEVELFPLALYSEHLQGVWKRLYTTEVDGLSFNRIAHHILGYDGPTCFLIKVRGDRRIVIGGFADERWKENNRFYGGFRDFVFALEPSIKICRGRSDGNQQYRWLNTKSYSQPHGLGFGGSTEAYRIFIPESLETCTARSSCLTYEPGKLLPDNPPGDFNFEIDTLEVWACGGEKIVTSGLQSQRQHRGQEQANINKARKVDKAAFFNNSFDQEFLLTNTMQHRTHASDRDGT